MYPSWYEDILDAMFTDNHTGACECCGHVGDIVICDSRRMDDRKELNLCVYCAQEHHEYWDEMWKEYWAGRL